MTVQVTSVPFAYFWAKKQRTEGKKYSDTARLQPIPPFPYVYLCKYNVNSCKAGPNKPRKDRGKN